MTRVTKFGLAAATAMTAFSMSAQAQVLEQAIGVSQETAAEAAASQDRINTLDDQTSAIVREFRATLRQIDALERYNATLQRQIRSQENEILELRDQIENVANLQREVLPMMDDMLGALEEFVAADTPFLEEERAARVARLQALMGDAAASPADKYRSIMEAFEIESEYGRTIEAYEGYIGEGDARRKVDFLRVGRVALVYATLDLDELGIWNNDSREWEQLPGSYRDDVSLAVRMAKELVPPDLLTIPVAAPEQAPTDAE